MERVRFTRDPSGRVMAAAEPPRDVLADFLAHELGSNEFSCRWVLEVLRQLREREIEAREVAGHAWTLRLNRHRAEFISEDSVPGRKVSLPAEELEEAVTAWLQFIQDGHT